MASLKLTLDTLDTIPETSERSWHHDLASQKSPIAWLEALTGKRRIVGGQVAGTTNFTPRKLGGILRDFIQPDSKMSVRQAAESILVLIPAGSTRCREIYLFGMACIEIAEQIPYNHPSHLKLAYLFKSLDTSSKFTDIDPSPHGGNVFVKYQLLNECILDNIYSPQEESPQDYVSFQAFMATLYAAGVSGHNSDPPVGLMRDAFEEESKESWEADCYIMSASLWITIYGQNLFQQIVYPGFVETDPRVPDPWRLGEHIPEGEKMACRSVERWRFWKSCFERNTENPHSSEDCKDVSRRAAVLMEAIDKTRLF